MIEMLVCARQERDRRNTGILPKLTATPGPIVVHLKWRLHAPLSCLPYFPPKLHQVSHSKRADIADSSTHDS